MKWKFVQSASDKENWLKHDLNEVCFIGRSNVGKSTLINELAKQNKLAKTSKTPGRTQLINYFQVDDKLMVVDLPGYGYAKISKSIQEKMFKMVDQYFTESKPKFVFVLIDSRHGIQEQDEEIINYLLNLQHNVVLVATKSDKATQSEVSKTKSHALFKELKYFICAQKDDKKLSQLRNFLLDEACA